MFKLYDGENHQQCFNKYVYGRGLIGEETNGNFKTYHFDYRGSTVALTNINGNIIDTFEYDTYGKLTGRTGTSDVIFLYNGRDGVVTDGNGLIYMRARYYSPELRRFVNADILAGDIANAITLNRYAYANGNPVSLIDPRGLSADERKATIYVFYDPEAFSRQAEDERKYLISEYNTDNVVLLPINSKDELVDAWNTHIDSAQGATLMFHGGPYHLWINEDFMNDEVSLLNEADLDFLRLLSCNGGHKDVENNVANSFNSHHDIDTLYAMDGSLSFYPRNWYLIGHDYSKYEPRLAVDQRTFYKHASYVREYVGPNVGSGYINKKREPTGLYIVE